MHTCQGRAERGASVEGFTDYQLRDLGLKPHTRTAKSAPNAARTRLAAAKARAGATKVGYL